MRIRMMLSVVAALGLLAGCGSDVGDSGSSLRAVDEDSLTSQTLYLAPEISELPMTAADLTARGIAEHEVIPVRIEVFDQMAVAWFAPAGEPIIGRDTIVALWTVVDRVAYSDETWDDSDSSLDQTTGTVEVLYLAEGDLREDLTATVSPTPAQQTIIDFADRLGTPDELPMLEDLVTYHPGCI